MMVSKQLAELTLGDNLRQLSADPENNYLKQLILDTIACAVGGLDGPYAKEISEFFTSFSNVPQATVLSTGKKSSVVAAAVVNTYLGRVHTFDDTYEAGVVHAGSPVIMSCLAMGEWLNTPMEEILAAIVAGYEVACSCSYAVNPAHYSHGFHPSGTCNGMGVAAATSKLLGLSVEQTTLAIQLAADMACGFRQYQLDGNMVNSAFHAAKAAENGIEAALIAKGGFAGPGESVSGSFGLFQNMAGGYDSEKLFDNRGKHPRYMDVSIKPFPSCRYMHGGVDAVIRCMAENNIAKENIKAIRIQTYALAKEEGDRKELGSVLNAQFSLQYNIGGYLIYGGLGIKHFTNQAINHPDYSQWAERITVEEDEALSAMYPEKWPYRAIIETNDGKICSYLSSYPPGAPENPMAKEELSKKWRLLMDPVIGEEKTTRLMDTIFHIERVNAGQIWSCI